MSRFLLPTLLLVANTAYSTTITLDFQEFYGSVAGMDNPGTFESQGFTVDTSNSEWLPDWGAAGNLAIGVGPSGSLRVSAADGGLFNLDAFDYGAAQALSINVLVVGEGGRSDVFSLGGIDTNATGLTTYELGGVFNNIVSFTFLGNGSPVLDNIQVTAVPIPAAVWLFGSALAALGWIKRNRELVH